MAIIVNKEEKRRNIACACKDILLDQGIRNITVSQIAKTAGIGKGTIYEYFENKEDIVFEIITSFISEYEQNLQCLIEKNESTREKLFHFLYHIYDDENSQEKLRTYREFLAISMTSKNHDMIEFDTKVRERFLLIMQEIMKEGIAKKEIKSESMGLSSGILTFSLGLLVNVRTAGLEPREEIEHFLNTLFELIEIKGRS